MHLPSLVVGGRPFWRIVNVVCVAAEELSGAKKEGELQSVEEEKLYALQLMNVS